MKTKLLIFIVVLIITAGSVTAAWRLNMVADDETVSKETNTLEPNSTLPAKTSVPRALPLTAKRESPIPERFSLNIPFTAQAPTGNWDKLHNEGCEEASAIMASAYLKGDKRDKLPAGEVEKSIAMLVDWEQQNLGYFLDTTAVETASMIRSVYQLEAEVVRDYSESDIKKALLANKVVILPVNGRIIGNPNYKQPGPIYHMLVVRGYTATKIVTNDPGTRNGKNYMYLFSTLKNAAADWNHDINTITPKPVMIVVSKPAD